MKASFRTFLLLVLVYQSESCFAQLVLPARDVYLSVRSLGMGDASVGVADSEDAILQNPAGIGFADRRLSSSQNPQSGLFPNMSASSNAFTLNQIQEYFNNSQSDQVKAVQANILNAPSEDVIYGRASLFPTVVWKRFQFGILFDSQVSGYTTDESSPKQSEFDPSQTYDQTFTLFSTTQVGTVMGSSIPLNKRAGLSLGFATRWLARSTAFDVIEGENGTPLESSVNEAENNINQTYGAALDLGMMVAPPKMPYFKFGVALQNTGDATYMPMSSSDETEVDKMAINMGVSLNPSLGRNLGLLLAIEENKINDPRVLFRDKVRLGSELSLGSYTGRDAPLSFRAGYSMRSFSAGMSLNVIFAFLEVATYGEVVNTNNGYVVDRRYAAKLTVNLVD